ncbi:hypothetical protein EDB19DRAFT_1755985 [Suillus lakei]|nr:hypothetical protein EDB19DRAFT_1755985 [Suillus lakei]
MCIPRTIDRAVRASTAQMKGPLPFVVGLRATPPDILGARRVLLAKNLAEMLLRELASVDQPGGRATEYLHYRQFFTIWDSLDRVVECRSLEVSVMNRNPRAAWLSDYKGH